VSSIRPHCPILMIKAEKQLLFWSDRIIAPGANVDSWGDGKFLVPAHCSWTCSVDTGRGTRYPIVWTDCGSIL
jgi:hypothetical protein